MTNPRKAVLIVSAALLVVMVLYPPMRICREIEAVGSARLTEEDFERPGVPRMPSEPVKPPFVENVFLLDIRDSEEHHPRYVDRVTHELSWSRATLEVIGWLTLTAVGIALTGRKKHGT